MDNGEEILVDCLEQGSYIGASSMLIGANHLFRYKTRTEVAV